VAQVAAYHRPENLDRALSLLAVPGRVALAGGTVLNADREPPAVEVVDLQAVGLAVVDALAEGGLVRLGAMATLDRVGTDPAVPSWLQGLARAELPSTLRTLATVGGTVVAGGPDSVLLAGLLAAGATVEVSDRSGGSGAGPPRALAELLAEGLAAGSLVTAVTVTATGVGAVAATGRTPADVPIVAAVAHWAEGAGGAGGAGPAEGAGGAGGAGPAEGAGGAVTLALTGVAATPVLADPDDPGAGLDPPGDFRGSPGYRLHLARTLAARAVAEVTR
jgi:CO/xanthine dehydrogenase FAD-binding subunit